MTKPVEFSKFYRALNSAKEGDADQGKELKRLLETYKNSDDSDSPLHELGQIFLYVGIMELYNYAGSEDIHFIGGLTQADWNDLSERKKADLPPHLANTMIVYAKKNNLSQKISGRWDISRGELDKNIRNMARYITEGIIDAID